MLFGFVGIKQWLTICYNAYDGHATRIAFQFIANDASTQNWPWLILYNAMQTLLQHTHTWHRLCCVVRAIAVYSHAFALMLMSQLLLIVSQKIHCKRINFAYIIFYVVFFVVYFVVVSGLCLPRFLWSILYIARPASAMTVFFYANQ